MARPPRPATPSKPTTAAKTTAPAVRPAGKAAAKAAPAAASAAPLTAAPAPAAATPQVAKPAKPAKAPKPPKERRKPVRDSFTMPPADFALIAALKSRALAAGRETKKSELLRAGLQALAALDTAALLAALGRLAPVKVGRPKKD